MHKAQINKALAPVEAISLADASPPATRDIQIRLL